MTGKEDRAIFYGGSFDPPHLGHEACVRLAYELDPAAEIYVVPAYVPPAGAGQVKQTEAGFEHRLAMCRLAFPQVLPAAQVHVSDIEAKLPAPSYTLQTIQALMQKDPDKSWTLLMGADQLANLGRWHKVAELLQHVNLLVIGRQMADSTDSLEESLQNLAHSLQMRLIKTSECLFRWDHIPSKQVRLAEQNVSPAASRLLRQGSSKARFQDKWLNLSVQEYIRRQQLYQDDKA
ncbi:MAG: nicotinate (nicotinamide) nucleotide adenylyltransferase [Oligoflexus sp.]